MTRRKVKAILTFAVRNPCAGENHRRGEQMFEVTRYDHPHIFVTRHRTGETYKFSIGNEGALNHEDARSRQGEARRTAFEYLAQKARAA